MVDALWDKLHDPAAAARADAGVARRRREEWAELQRAAEERSAEQAEQMEQMGQDESGEQELRVEREPRAERPEPGGQEGPGGQADEAEADISGQGPPPRYPDALVAPI